MRQQFATKFWKTHIAPAGNYIVGQLNDFLLAVFVTDFRPTQHHPHIWRHPFEQRDHFGAFLDIPDVNAQTDNLRLCR